MRQVRLGQTDLRVSAIAFGTWAFGGDWGAADIQESKNAIQHAVELGINLFDTAQGYGFGAAEQLLGEALRERTSREDVVIATKGGLRMEGDRLLVGAHRPSQLDGTAPAADIEMSEADRREIDAILTDAAPVSAPHPEGM